MSKKANNPLTAPLCTAWPKVFSNGAPKPLKIGIHKDMVGPEFSPERISGLMRAYVNRPTYLKQLTAGATRYDLDGEPSGMVTAEAAETAVRKLGKFKRRKKTQVNEEATRPGKAQGAETRATKPITPPSPSAGKSKAVKVEVKKVRPVTPTGIRTTMKPTAPTMPTRRPVLSLKPTNGA